MFTFLIGFLISKYFVDLCHPAPLFLFVVMLVLDSNYQIQNEAKAIEEGHKLRLGSFFILIYKLS
jgi:hypothetical protein